MFKKFWNWLWGTSITVTISAQEWDSGKYFCDHDYLWEALHKKYPDKEILVGLGGMTVITYKGSLYGLYLKDKNSFYIPEGIYSGINVKRILQSGKSITVKLNKI